MTIGLSIIIQHNDQSSRFVDAIYVNDDVELGFDP